MTFTVSADCTQLGLRAGAVVFRDLCVAPASSALRWEIAREVQVIQARFSDARAVRAIPEVAGFRAILRKVGVNPRQEQSSVERLLAFALKRGDLPAINSLVDAYNLVSIRSFCSLGAHDLDRIALPVALRLLDGCESFTALGRDKAEAVTPGEYAYVDANNRVLCRLDLLQAEFSKVTASTVHALLIIEGTPAHPPQTLQQTFADAIELVIRYCGGTAEIVAFPGQASRNERAP